MKLDFLKALSNIIFPLYSLCYVGFGSLVGNTSCDVRRWLSRLRPSLSRIRRSKKATCDKSIVKPNLITIECQSTLAELFVSSSDDYSE